MNEKVTNSQILQAVTELSKQVQNLSKQMKQTEEKLDAKVTMLSEGLLNT